jgi:hypothetical protein
VELEKRSNLQGFGENGAGSFLRDQGDRFLGSSSMWISGVYTLLFGINT